MKVVSGDETDVLVVGGGPVGLTLAFGLARQGVRCRVVDREAGTSRAARASELHARTLEILDGFGVAQAIVDAGLAMGEIVFISHGRVVARIGVAAVDSPFPARLGIAQSSTEEILMGHLQAAGVSVERERELVNFVDDGAGVTATFRAGAGGAATVRAAWLVGCDGFHSTVRQRLAVPFEGEGYPGIWALVDARIDGWNCPNDTVFVFLGADALWSAALPGGWRRLFFRHEQATRLPTPEEAQAALAHHVPGATIREIISRGSFKLHRRMATRFRVGRVMLAGDAAHVCSPSAGVGLNAGMQDAANLAWKLGLIVSGHASESLLDTYETERKVADATALALSHASQTDMLVADTVHDRELAAHFATPAAQMLATEAGVELQINYRKSLIVAGTANGLPVAAEAWMAGPAPGDRVLDAGPLVDARGRRWRLRDVLRGPRHALLVLAGKASEDTRQAYATLAAALMADFGALLSAHLIVIGDAPPPSNGVVPLLADPELVVHGRLGAVADTAYVVRPDGYLAYRGEPPDASDLVTYFRGLLRGRAGEWSARAT